MQVITSEREDHMSAERALGSICIIADSIPRKTAPKLTMEPGSKEGFYMLAAYCFNLARKMEYVFKATREFGREADPTLARDIKTTGDEIYGNPKSSWQEIAKKEEEALLRVFRDIEAEHERLLNAAVNRRD
jgi:hypothetical protein